ncbi:hypothetical protein [Armatimonas sp.]|uniref:hypothetical protein n=1 Tax=Armatimonas sp. TaxID=1872638 RepID=UPI00286BB90A|nr:hypothetical protein [Armatimonas sp.]
MFDRKRELEDVRETLLRAQKRGERATLVIGAGCSVSAGIPLAEEFVQRIEQEYPQAAQRATERSYDAYLHALSPLERRALVGKFVKKARVNPAHLAIAHLIKGGFVDRVLTTNFDPLLPRACALTGEFPSVYNLPQLSLDDLAELPEQALFYLQGQSALSGRKRPRLLRAIFEEASHSRPVIVIGYRGADSTLFPRLAAHSRYENRLYWVGDGEMLPLERVLKRLIRPGKEAYWVPGYDADTFLVQLVRQLGVFSADFADRLLEHPQAVLETLSPAAQPDQLLERLPLTGFPTPKILHPSVAAAQLREADSLVDRAQLKANLEADALFETAYAHYAGALTSSENVAEAATRWAMALSEQAKLKTGVEAEQLLRQACDKYHEAFQYAPGDPQIEYLWGMALARRAQLTRAESSLQHLQEAQEHLAHAEEGHPGIAAYFLACLCGSKNDLVGLERWLTRCKSTHCLPPRSLIESNPALRLAKDMHWFDALFAPAEPKPAALTRNTRGRTPRATLRG